MIEFRVEWQDALGVRDPVLARTWCRLTMDVDGQVVSRAIDHRSDSLRDGIYGSACRCVRGWSRTGGASSTKPIGSIARGDRTIWPSTSTTGHGFSATVCGRSARVAYCRT